MGVGMVVVTSVAVEAPLTVETMGTPGTVLVDAVPAPVGVADPTAAAATAAAAAAAFATAVAAAAAVVPTPSQPCRFFKCRFMCVVRLSTL